MKRGHRRRRQLGAIEREVLQDLSLGDMLYGFLLSGRSVRSSFRIAEKRARDRYRRKLAIRRLLRHNYIKKAGGAFSITHTGSSALQDAARRNFAQLKVKKWDGKWRIVAYDIPEERSDVRKAVRGILKRAGFAKLQQSIWLFPHDCDELMQLVQRKSDLSEHILYGKLDRIEGEGRLKKMFGL